MSGKQLIIYAVAGFVTSILAGMSGGGGGFVMTPLGILLGLTPQQAIATGKINGLAVSLGSLYGFRNEKVRNWKFMIPVMVLAGIIGLIAPLFITTIDNDAYQKILGVLLLVMIPVLFIKQVGQHSRKVSKKQTVLGWGLLTITLLMQAVFSSGMGLLVNVALMVGMGMPALQANLTKRYAQVVLNGVIILGVIGSGLVVWQVGLVTIVGSFVGGEIGTRIAIKKGDRFIMILFAILMFVSGVQLLTS